MYPHGWIWHFEALRPCWHWPATTTNAKCLQLLSRQGGEQESSTIVYAHMCPHWCRHTPRHSTFSLLRVTFSCMPFSFIIIYVSSECATRHSRPIRIIGSDVNSPWRRKELQREGAVRPQVVGYQVWEQLWQRSLPHAFPYLELRKWQGCLWLIAAAYKVITGRRGRGKLGAKVSTWPELKSRGAMFSYRKSM